VRPEAPRLEARRAESGSGVVETPARGSGELMSTVSSPSGRAAKGLSCILNTQDDLSGQQDHRDFTFLASWPSGRARGRARTKTVGPRPYLVYS